MDQDTADAITVMEKQGAEKDQKIAELERNITVLLNDCGALDARLSALESAANAFVEGLKK